MSAPPVLHRRDGRAAVACRSAWLVALQRRRDRRAARLRCIATRASAPRACWPAGILPLASILARPLAQAERESQRRTRRRCPDCSGAWSTLLQLDHGGSVRTAPSVPLPLLQGGHEAGAIQILARGAAIMLRSICPLNSTGVACAEG